MLDRSRVEFLTNTGTGLNDMTESEFDSVFIMDRDVDFITLMKTQMTYEGLLDELYSIKSSFVELDASFFTVRNQPTSTHLKPKKVLLNNTDLVFEKIRDIPFELVGEILNETALEIKIEEDSRHSMTTTSQLKEFASKLGVLQSRRQSLDTHEKVYRRILSHASEPPTKRKWQVEERIVS
jgi:vacuolar protein sorting-associated protein 33A